LTIFNCYRTAIVAIVDAREAWGRGEDELARKKLGEAIGALEALGRLMRR
jgi:hypothetical protein